ncbi:MAG: PIN/TRAM domain-containing protein [Luteolibacter sp.]
MASHPSVNVARLIYLLVCEAAGVAIALSTKGLIDISIVTGLLGGLGVAAFFIWIETLMKGFTLRGFSTASFGLAVGLFCAWLLTRVEISNLLELALRGRLQDDPGSTGVELDVLRLTVNVTLFASLGFLGAVLALRSNRDDFAFIIPYVRFRQDASSGQPVVLDGDAVMDGRVLPIFRSGFLHGRLIVPRFVLDDLQARVDAGTNADRHRAQRGLDCLEQLQKAPDIQISIHDTNLPGDSEVLHSRLIETTRLLGARLMTVDENLAKVAKIQGLDVLNLHDLDDALKPTIAVGERLRIALVRTGKEDHQAVGYLPDGTMIVVNHAIAKMGSTVDAIVVSTLQTTSGTMVFSELYKPA